MNRARKKSSHKNGKKRPAGRRRSHRDSDLTLGVEVESYTLTLDKLHIGRRLMFPKKGVIERGESYHRDRSIGIEYASKPFRTIRESLFGIKAGLRKSMVQFRFDPEHRGSSYVLFFSGTWRDRFAASHFHVGLGPEGIDFADAESLAGHLHAHLPLLIALLANSPVYKERITNTDSNRFVNADEKFFFPVEPGHLDREMREEMTFNCSRKKIVPTLELRPCDANLPEYLAAGLVIVKAATMGWMHGWPPPNQNNFHCHVKARNSAGRRGPNARLFWNNRPIAAPDYLDRFFKAYRPFLSKMDIPADVLETLKLFKLGWNGAKIMRNACSRHQRAHPRIWQRYFAEEYIPAIVALLNGENLHTFMRQLGLRPPPTKPVRLGGGRW